MGQENNNEINRNEKDPEINIAYFGGVKKDLTQEEAQHLEESPEMLRALKAKRQKEKDNNK